MSDEELAGIRERVAEGSPGYVNRGSYVTGADAEALLAEVGRLRVLLRTAQTFLDERDEANAELRAEVERLRDEAAALLVRDVRRMIGRER